MAKRFGPLQDVYGYLDMIQAHLNDIVEVKLDSSVSLHQAGTIYNRNTRLLNEVIRFKDFLNVQMEESHSFVS